MANQDPATMTDEELEKALEAAGTPEPEAPEEEEPENPETPEKKEADPEEEEQPDPNKPAEGAEEKPKGNQPSRREQRRVTDLLKKYPELGKPEAPVAPKAPADILDLDKDLEADDALKTRLKADRDAAAKAAFEQGQAEGAKTANQERASILFHTRLEIDAPRIESKYPVLDPNSDKYKEALSKDVNTLYLQASGYDFEKDTVTNPNIRYSDFVEAFFTAANDAATEIAETSKKNVVKQAAQTGLRPDGSAPKKLNLNKLPQQMTDEELDAIIAQAIPSK